MTRVPGIHVRLSVGLMLGFNYEWRTFTSFYSPQRKNKKSSIKILQLHIHCSAVIVYPPRAGIGWIWCGPWTRYLTGTWNDSCSPAPSDVCKQTDNERSLVPWNPSRDGEDGWCPLALMRRNNTLCLPPSLIQIFFFSWRFDSHTTRLWVTVNDSESTHKNDSWLSKRVNEQ